MTDLYLLWFVWGIASGIVGAFLAHRRGASSKFAILSRILLYLGTIGALLVAVAALAHQFGALWLLLYTMAGSASGLWMDGVIVVAVIAARKSALWALAQEAPILSAARYLAAATFLMVGVVKWVTYAEFPFFQASGYSEAFYIFVCAFECVAALGLLLRSTAFFTSLILLMEMCGAVYTHFHNYFAKGLADPFGNSLDAFRMLILLSYIAFATRPLAARL